MVGYAGSPYTYCVCWCDLDSIQDQHQRHGAFELPTISEAVHAGGDDRSSLAGLSGFLLSPSEGLPESVTIGNLMNIVAQCEHITCAILTDFYAIRKSSHIEDKIDNR